MSYNLDKDEYGFPREGFPKAPSKEPVVNDKLEEADEKGKLEYENKINDDRPSI